MNKFLIAAAALSLTAPSLAAAQPSDHERNSHGEHSRHGGWGQDYGAGHSFHGGERMGYNDWNGASRIDYRQHNLRRPPRGYEWRQSNDQFILGAVATGLIASAVMRR